ncbi:MAG: glycosyltransferase [Cyclobacteriaceae bacterium]
MLIPVRNEEKNLDLLLNDLSNQYVLGLDFDVIVIDDDSNDESKAIVLRRIDELPFNCQLLDLKAIGKTGKKAALTYGVAHAKGDVILTTDGDCSVGKHWIQSFAEAFLDPAVCLVSGPVMMKAQNWFQSMQALEFSGLIGIGAATLKSGNPTMCNGANLAYRKSDFLSVKGYEGNEHIASGDDEFLLQKIYKKKPEGIIFLKNSDSIVKTPAKENFKELINQRIRWSSKWRFHQSIFIKLGAVLIFLNYVGIYTAIILALWDYKYVSITIFMILIRWIILTLFLSNTAGFLNIPVSPIKTFLLEIIYPALVLFLGIASIFGRYTWKGRNYQ